MRSAERIDPLAMIRVGLVAQVFSREILGGRERTDSIDCVVGEPFHERQRPLSFVLRCPVRGHIRSAFDQRVRSSRTPRGFIDRVIQNRFHQHEALLSSFFSCASGILAASEPRIASHLDSIEIQRARLPATVHSAVVPNRRRGLPVRAPDAAFILTALSRQVQRGLTGGVHGGGGFGERMMDNANGLRGVV